MVALVRPGRVRAAGSGGVAVGVGGWVLMISTDGPGLLRLIVTRLPSGVTITMRSLVSVADVSTPDLTASLTDAFTAAVAA